MALFRSRAESSRTQVDLDRLQATIAAIHRSQAVIEFNLDGTIVTANENFLATVGYGLDEIKGRHHSLFCEATYGQSGDYREFWRRLNAGESSPTSSSA